MKPPAIVERYRSEIDGEIKAIFERRPSPMYDMMRYHLGWIDVQGNPVRKDG
jgi:hypothetical protein